jgi:hypothetical protein
MNKQSIDFFLSLFDKTPELRVLVFHRDNQVFVDLLSDNLNNINPRIRNLQFTKELIEKDFRLTPRAFEYAVIVDVFDGGNSHLLNEIYHSLENSANIVVISKKSSSVDSYFLRELLDEHDFRAVNEIDIFDDYYLVTGKKMHMWGAGL